AIFATNTSSIAIDRLAAAVGDDRRARFVGMHFFSPVPVMPLVELIRGSATTDETEAAIRELTEVLGRKLIGSADRPGFIVNRILMPMLAEAMRILEEGSATADDIDAGAKVGLNHPMGPLELADFIGLDVCLNVMKVLEDGIGEEHYPPPKILVDLVEAGHLGQKTGRGLHTSPGAGPAPRPAVTSPAPASSDDECPTCTGRPLSLSSSWSWRRARAQSPRSPWRRASARPT